MSQQLTWAATHCYRPRFFRDIAILSVRLCVRLSRSGSVSKPLIKAQSSFQSSLLCETQTKPSNNQWLVLCYQYASIASVNIIDILTSSDLCAAFGVINDDEYS